MNRDFLATYCNPIAVLIVVFILGAVALSQCPAVDQPSPARKEVAE